MGFICAQVSLQYGDRMWLQFTPGSGEFKVLVTSPLLQKADRTGLCWENNQVCDALQSKDTYCSDRSSMKNSERMLGFAFISALGFSRY